jgi:hypothetical protein
MKKGMRLLALSAALVAAVLCAAAAAAPLASGPVDVELAIDTTGSMGPSIGRVQRDAVKLVGDVKKPRAGCPLRRRAVQGRGRHAGV